MGRGIARALLGAGWQVALAGRREEALRETASSDDGLDASALVVPADVTSPDSVAELFGTVQRQCGRFHHYRPERARSE